ncbi:HNH endonuclease [Streptomyces sp. NPDC002536]
MDVDHVRPLALGGTDTDGNVQVLCRGCHKTKTRAEFGVTGPAVLSGSKPQVRQAQLLPVWSECRREGQNRPSRLPSAATALARGRVTRFSIKVPYKGRELGPGKSRMRFDHCAPSVARVGLLYRSPAPLFGGAPHAT